MRIGRNNIAFNAIRSKLIRSRRTKVKSSTRNSVWTSQSTQSTNKSSLANTLLAQKKALAAKNSGKSTTTSASQTALKETKTNYTNMETAAENTRKHLQKLLDTGESSLWGNDDAEPKTEPDTVKIKEEITDFADYYNDMIQSLDETGGTINTMYKKQFHNYVISHKSKLEKIGITENKYGKLEVDKDKLKEAETESLRELFQGEAGFADKVYNKCKKVEENAEANLNSLNSATYSSLLASYGSSGSRFDSEA